MSSKTIMTEQDVEQMQERIDKGILLAQQRLLKRALHDNLSLVIYRDGMVMDVPATDIRQWN